MCVGLPMRIRESHEGWAIAEHSSGERRRVSLLLVGSQPLGTAVLVHLDTAVRVLDEAEVPLLERALEAVAAAGRGEPFEHLLGDLLDRAPQLPAHLRAEEDTP